MQNKFLPKIIIISILLTWLFPIFSFAEMVGAFSKVEGRVDILKAGATAASPVKTGDDAAMGDIVRTKSDGKAEITFKDDTTIRLAPETRMKLDEYVFNPDNSRSKGVLGLFRGKVRAVVSKARGGIIPVGFGESTFNINTPTAIAGVRGTDFFVFFDKGITGVIFREGQGFVVNPNVPERIVNVSAGQVTFVVQFDAPPSPPRLATGIELAVHTKDTEVKEKPKEMKEVKNENTEDDKDAKDDKEHVKKDKKEVEDKKDAPDTGRDGDFAHKDDAKDAKDAARDAKTIDAAKEEKDSETATLTYNPMTEASPRDEEAHRQAQTGQAGYSSAFTTDIGVIPDTIATTITIPPTSLIPVTETQPSLLTDVKVNLIFR
ncbi:MAG: FecR domain-containing protein [Nitrospinae bacterium]|nr:FecR domain-containing protein [Nitrospinota bacterium]